MEWYIRHSDNQSDILEHHGILGMKWGIRRFQNKDGTRTSAGKKRYLNGQSDSKKQKRRFVQYSQDSLQKMSVRGDELIEDAQQDFLKTKTSQYEDEWRKKNPDADPDDLGDDDEYRQIARSEKAELDAIHNKAWDGYVLKNANRYMRNPADLRQLNQIADKYGFKPD